jgi:hypothetical protein
MGHLMSEAEIAQLRHAGMGKRLGFGARPALLIIDAQNYMVGATGPDDRKRNIRRPARRGGPRSASSRALAEGFRAAGQPVFYTRNVARRDGRDMGVKLLKRGLLDIEGWYLDGTKGAEIVPAIAPQPQDIVLVKTKQSGFHGTPAARPAGCRARGHRGDHPAARPAIACARRPSTAIPTTSGPSCLVTGSSIASAFRMRST